MQSNISVNNYGLSTNFLLHLHCDLELRDMTLDQGYDTQPWLTIVWNTIPIHWIVHCDLEDDDIKSRLWHTFKS